MSDLLNSASLVMIPSGYAEDKVYSVVPSDGSGDMTLTRASNGTRVNSAGLVEVCPWNLLQYSEDFSNAVWTKTNVALTAGQADPNGGTTATTIDPTNTTSSFIRENINITIGSTYTWSVYIKGSTTGQNIALYTDGASNVYEVKAITTSWQRINIVATATSSGSSGFYILCGGGYSMTDLPFNVAFAQVNIGSTAKPYFPTTDRLNVPRLTYQNGGGGCPSLLLEKQSTNICSQSRNFQTTWTNSNVTITANSTTDVYGTTEAQKIEATGSGIHRCAQFLSTTSGSVYALSIDAKKGSTDWVMIRHDNGGSLNYFNLNTGTKGATCDASALIENVGNGWYRLTVFHTTSSSSGPELYVAKGNNDHDFTANGEYIYIDNVQYEQSSYPTSRIITTSSSATRVADACFKTGISSLIGQTEGTALLDFQFNGVNDAIILDIAASGLSPQNRIILYQPNSTAVQFIVLYNDTNPVSIASSSYAVGQRLKVAIAYKENDFAFYINGVQIGIDSSGSVPATSRIDIGNRQDGAYPASITVNEFYLSKTRLTNAQLASLTTI